MNIGIYVNLDKDPDCSLTKRIVGILTGAGNAVLLHDSLKGTLQGQYFSNSSAKKPEVLITVGGDGTILRIVGYCAQNQIPILGVNLGNVGFLTELEADNLDILFELFTKKDYAIESRSMISACYNEKTFCGLNDIVLLRSAMDKMVNILVTANDELIDRYFCDGFIACTPTGSTGYFLSAGGPVVNPNTSAFGLIPINSHSLHSRPIIISDRDKICATMNGSFGAEIIVDGQNVGSIAPNGKICIEKADVSAKFIRLPGSNYYNKLLTKLNKWSVTL